MKKQNSAFSLIELSIVILVIGILIAGVFQGRKMVLDSELRAARALTKSSPVPGIKNLVLWLETTSEESFLDSESSDGMQLTRWNDINPQLGNRFFARKTASNSAKYIENSPIGGLPSIYLDGSASGQFLLSTSSSSAVATPVPTQNDFTFFVVSMTDFSKISGWAYIMDNGVDGSNGFSYSVFSGNGSKSITVWGSFDPSTPAATPRTPEVVSYTYAGGTLGAQKIYSNGVNYALSTTNVTYTKPTTRFLIGARTTDWQKWSGWLSEIIIFDKYLNDNDRKAVEKYLAQKYSIKINQ
ncbi:MAG: prepilin-type N-terminal cleavage/methylation domain-containing protein [Rickettsiales bacterium]|nr:prepilin-type N-terminal cleavage/methylation domain-containing protein [Rickettsiales bacterium]